MDDPCPVDENDEKALPFSMPFGGGGGSSNGVNEDFAQQVAAMGGQLPQMMVPMMMGGGQNVDMQNAAQMFAPFNMMLPFMMNPSSFSRVALPTEIIEEQPTYVNAKQYRRIIKRRQARAKLEQKKKIPNQRKAYMHESRHAHAMRRLRGPGGRFLTKAELDHVKRLQQQGKLSLDITHYIPEEMLRMSEQDDDNSTEQGQLLPLQGSVSHSMHHSLNNTHYMPEEMLRMSEHDGDHSTEQNQLLPLQGSGDHSLQLSLDNSLQSFLKDPSQQLDTGRNMQMQMDPGRNMHMQMDPGRNMQMNPGRNMHLQMDSGRSRQMMMPNMIQSPSEINFPPSLEMPSDQLYQYPGMITNTSKLKMQMGFQETLPGTIQDNDRRAAANKGIIRGESTVV